MVCSFCNQNFLVDGSKDLLTSSRSVVESIQSKQKGIFLDDGSLHLRVYMDLQQLHIRFPTEETCVAFLERTRWNGHIVCPYCDGSNVTAVPSEQRHHCNRCKASFSVTVKTFFHNSHVDLRKWVLAVILFLESDKVSGQHLSRVLKVNKNTAWYMKERLKRDAANQRTFMQAISKGVRA